jgi:hypothetical protein
MKVAGDSKMDAQMKKKIISIRFWEKNWNNINKWNNNQIIEIDGIISVSLYAVKSLGTSDADNCPLSNSTPTK